MTDDLQLIEATLAGDTGAFDVLVQRYQDRLFASLVHQLGCETEALDVAQEAFVLAFRKLDGFRAQSAFYSWLYRIARNVSISRRRRRRPEVSIDRQREQLGMDPVDQHRRPDEVVQKDEEVMLVRQALREVPEDFREILLLREFEGYDYEAIAELLGVAVGTVRSRLHRARLSLKERLEQLLQQ